MCGYHNWCSDAPIHNIDTKNNLNILVAPVPSDLAIEILEQIGRCRELRRCIGAEALDACNDDDHAVR